MTVFENDRELLKAFRAGERTALSKVYRFYADDVAGLIRRGFAVGDAGVTVPGVKEPAQQLDLVQEVFLRAFAERARLSYDGLSPFRPWLLRIAKNLVIDEGRRLGVIKALAARGDDEPTAVLPVSPEEELEWNTLREATKAYAGALSPALRDFVRLRFEEGCSQAELADRLQVSRRKVRTMEEEVRDGLRAHLRTRKLMTLA